MQERTTDGQRDEPARPRVAGVARRVAPVTGASASARRQVRLWSERHRDRIAEAIGTLVRVPTVAPDEPLAAGPLTDYLRGARFTVRSEPPHSGLLGHPDHTPSALPEPAPARPNLRAALPRVPGLPTVLFSAHTDVLPAQRHPEPWSGRFDGVRVHGRGSADTKGNIVMLVEAVRCLHELGLPMRANVELDLVSDEQAGGNGALSTLLHGVHAQEVVVLKPTGLTVHHGHPGCLGFEVEAQAAADGQAHRVDAVDACLAALDRLRVLERCWLEQAADCPGFERAARPLELDVSALAADASHWSDPDRCGFRATLGFLPDRTRAEAAAEIERTVLTGAGAERLRLSWRGIRHDAYLGASDGPAAEQLRAAVRWAGGAPGNAAAWQASCDARLYHRWSTAETLVFGCGDLRDAHTDHESIDVGQVLDGLATLVGHLTGAAQLSRGAGAGS
ncbi:M20/M25/M40 family metallo-hydrolase [Kitasatospora acidiphila]|uniref:M20/M25/M40 family metallo-hydrolase n=1 Tax=Kitasatospora acidiphila TaxID=2567942 RepID=A0A540WDC2_9ACTN|nr:M20/M25/M40 family metallo-hydrolase [Kitasatospora acidiphila]